MVLNKWKNTLKASKKSIPPIDNRASKTESLNFNHSNLLFWKIHQQLLFLNIIVDLFFIDAPFYLIDFQTRSTLWPIFLDSKLNFYKIISEKLRATTKGLSYCTYNTELIPNNTRYISNHFKADNKHGKLKKNALAEIADKISSRYRYWKWSFL